MKTHFVVPYRQAFLERQTRDTKMQLLRSWKKAAKAPTLDELAGKLTRMKQFAQLIPVVFDRDDLLFCK